MPLLQCVIRVVLALSVSINFILPSQAMGDEFDLLFTEFDARPMTDGEKRFLQAALAFEGDYHGLLDGAWGRGSQSALEAFVEREFPTDEPEPLYGHIYYLITEFFEKTEETGWDDTHFPEIGLSLAAPWGLLKPSEDRAGEWATGDETLIVRVLFDEPVSQIIENHNKIESFHTASAEPYLVRRSDRFVTSIQFADGGGSYLRSDRVSGAWSSVLVVADEPQHDMLGVIASGIHFGPPRSWHVPDNSVLASVVELGTRFVKSLDDSEPQTEREPAVAARQPPRGSEESQASGGPSGSGTAFYVNNTDLVTAEHVVAGCDAVTFEDSTNLTVIATDRDTDLAVLTSPKRSLHWLPVANTGQASLGEKAYVLGFPYYGLIGTSLNLTTGNVSALAGVGDDRRFISISAPVQPGNSGGPLLNDEGEILGVVSARLSELAIAEATGSLPQNVNYAATGAELIRFLQMSGVFFPKGQSVEFDMDEGAPETIQQAVVPVLCW